MNKRNSGITLVALVITIIVLLILAGVSIALVVGDNGVLSRSQEAKAGSIVAEETEQVNLAYSSALTKNLGDAVTAENLQAELDESVGSGKTTVTENGNNLKVLFNETGHSYNVNKGRITEGSDSTAGLTDLEKLQIYFGTTEWLDDENHRFKNIEPIPDASISIRFIENNDTIDGYILLFIIQYNNNYYLIEVIDTEQIEVSLLDFGIHNIGGENYLITPSTPDYLIHDTYEERTAVSDSYYLKNNEDLDFTRPFIGDAYMIEETDKNNPAEHIVYLYDKTTGELVDITLDGLGTFGGMYYEDYMNGMWVLDINRPFTEGYVSVFGRNYYDITGKRVKVGINQT